MKAKLTITIDESLIPQSKQYAAAHNTSLSQLIETALLRLLPSRPQSFTKKWRGKLKLHKNEGPRFKKLTERYELKSQK
jgi:hypothetical protein